MKSCLKKKRAPKTDDNDEALDLIDKLFIELAKTIVEKRTRFIRELNKVVNEVLLKLSDEHLSVRLTYESSLGSVQNIERNG